MGSPDYLYPADENDNEFRFRVKTAKYWIEKLSLQPHFEGGWYREIYKSDEKFNKMPERYGKNATRTFGTHIYYLLEGNDFAEFHHLNTDEIWQHYNGDTLILFVIDHKTGKLTRHFLGGDADNFVGIVKRGDYYAARLRDPGEGKYCLLGNTVSPGFEVDDYHRATRAEMLKQFPDLREEIITLTRV